MESLKTNKSVLQNVKVLFSFAYIRATITKDDPFGKRASACSCLIHDTFFNSVGLAVHFV